MLGGSCPAIRANRPVVLFRSASRKTGRCRVRRGERSTIIKRRSLGSNRRMFPKNSGRRSERTQRPAPASVGAQSICARNGPDPTDSACADEPRRSIGLKRARARAASLVHESNGASMASPSTSSRRFDYRDEFTVIAVRDSCFYETQGRKCRQRNHYCACALSGVVAADTLMQPITKRSRHASALPLRSFPLNANLAKGHNQDVTEPRPPRQSFVSVFLDCGLVDLFFS